MYYYTCCASISLTLLAIHDGIHSFYFTTTTAVRAKYSFAISLSKQASLAILVMKWAELEALLSKEVAEEDGVHTCNINCVNLT